VKVSRQDVLLNGYIDLGTWAGITPYIGAGVGVAVTQTAASVNYFETANGQPYNANLTPTGTYPPDWITDQLDINGNPIYATISNGQLVACPVGATPQTCTQPKVSFTQQSWNKKLNSTKYGFAWDLTGGFAVDVSAHMKLDIGYRYVNLGTFTGISPSGQTVSEKQSTQEIRAGFRYMVD
jgi:opacity protein-like surface antigen